LSLPSRQGAGGKRGRFEIGSYVKPRTVAWEAVRDGSIKNNDLVCLPVFGSGLTWGNALIKS